MRKELVSQVGTCVREVVRREVGSSTGLELLSAAEHPDGSPDLKPKTEAPFTLQAHTHGQKCVSRAACSPLFTYLTSGSFSSGFLCEVRLSWRFSAGEVGRQTSDASREAMVVGRAGTSVRRYVLEQT